MSTTARMHRRGPRDVFSQAATAFGILKALKGMEKTQSTSFYAIETRSLR